MNQVPKTVWFILGLLLLLQVTTLAIAIHKPAGKSYPSQTQQTIHGPQGPIGLAGAQGQPGLSIQGTPGEPGAIGIQGPPPTADQISSAVSTYLQANPPQGNTGPQGEPGTDGKSVEIRYANNEIEWRFSGDITWTPLVQACTLANSCVSQ